MPELVDFHAPGVTFPNVDRSDIEVLVGEIPEEGTLQLAVLQQPYMDLVASGEKTVESRFNVKRAAPYGRVAVGDLVLLKEPGRPVSQYFFASFARSLDLYDTPLDEVRSEYAAAVLAQDEEAYWASKRTSRYCTLIGIGRRGLVPDLAVIKKDQRGWVTFSSGMPDDPMLF